MRSKLWPLRQVIATSLGIVLVGVLLFCGSPAPITAPKVVWLPATQDHEAEPPGRMARWQTKLIRSLPSPLRNRWLNHLQQKPGTLIEALVLECPREAAEPVALGPPTATHANGMRVWICAPKRWNKKLEDELLRRWATTDTWALTRPRIWSPGTMDYSITHPASGPSGGSFGGLSSYRAPFPKFKMRISPQYNSDTFTLTLSINISDQSAPEPGRASVGMACRAALLATVPNTGAVIIECAGSAAPHDCYWLILRPSWTRSGF